jgi:nucleoside-diphosphate-sugar epimerase
VATWAITGGSGFLGLHLIRRLLAEGSAVRSLDFVPLEAALSEAGAESVVGDVRCPADVERLCAGAEVVVHAAAALPIQRAREAIRSVNVDGTANVLEAAAKAGVRRVVHISSTAVYGVPRVHPIPEDLPLDPVGAYGETKIAAEALCRAYSAGGGDAVIIRPKTFLGPERLGVFEILFDWIREGRRIYTIGDGRNRYQLLAVEDLVDAVLLAAEKPVAGEAFNIGAKEFATVGEELRALVEHAGSASRVTPLPARPVQLTLRALELARVSPLAEWHYRTADKDSYVSVEKAERELGWSPRFSNLDTLVAAYDWYLENRERLAREPGLTHRVPWDQKVLRLVKRLS